MFSLFGAIMFENLGPLLILLGRKIGGERRLQGRYEKKKDGGRGENARDPSDKGSRFRRETKGLDAFIRFRFRSIGICK